MGLVYIRYWGAGVFMLVNFQSPVRGGPGAHEFPGTGVVGVVWQLVLSLQRGTCWPSRVDTLQELGP